MKIGVCVGIENAEIAAKAGFSYLEFSLSQLAAMEDGEFEALCKKVQTAPIPVLCCNGFMPGTIKVTGPEADVQAWHAYLEKALSRAAAVGIKTAVFGSGASRSVPEGWPFEKAWQQLAAFFKTAAGYAEKYDVKIAIEPLRRQECNILNLVSEATQMAAWVDSDHVGVLADTFHMLASHEPWEAMEKAGDKLWHVHISSPLPDMSSRVFPYAGDGSDYAAVFKVLFQAGYQGNVSVEAGAADFAAEAKKAAALLNSFI